VRFWNAGQRPPEPVDTLSAHEQFINSAVFSPDGSLVLTASDDRTARLWNVQTRMRVHELKGHAGPVNRAVFSADGALVLTVSDDRTARLWDVRTGTPVGEPFRDGHSRPILTGAFSADAGRIVTGSEDNLAIVWSVPDRSPVAILGGHTAAITAVAFSADDARVFTASRDSTVKVWDVSRDGLAFFAPDAGGDSPRAAVKGVDLLTLSGHEREITSLAISADGRKVLTGSRDRTAIIWSAMEWPRAPQPRAAHGGGRTTAAFMERP
jgi:WD40 repeat protein